MADNVLYYGDNLDVLRKRLKDDSIDLIYLDPPFNSNRTYNVLFGHKSGEDAQAQIEAFDDTWTWSQDSEREYHDLLTGGGPPRVADVIEAMRKIVGDGDVLAYLVMMAPRLVELHRVLKPTGSLYLHCDPTASHYLKVLMDAVFGPRHFVNEIIWKRSDAHSDFGQGAKHLGRVHDTILFYRKSEAATFNPMFTPLPATTVEKWYRHVEPETGRRYNLADITGPGGAAKGNPQYEFLGVTRYWRYSKERMQQLYEAGRIVQRKPGTVPAQKRYLDESRGVALQDIWSDIDMLRGLSNGERLGYPTQKPLALLERIIATSSNEGDIVLDPFCGCGTAIEAAHALGRKWIGIDITYLAIDLIQKRMRHRFPEDRSTYEVDGIPRDIPGAHALFTRSPFDFERWAVSLVDGTPNERQVGDKGIDGVVRFPLDNKNGVGRALVSVKGGGVLTPAMVRDLIGTVETQRAEMGILISLENPTRGVEDAIRHSGTYTAPATGRSYPKTQLLTVEQLLAGTKPDMPTPLLPYIKAQRASREQQLTLGEAIE